MKWGVLSTSSIATQVMIPGIQSSRNGRVSAIASRSEATATRVAERFGIPKAYGRYDALIDDPEIEAVYIPLPNSMHMEWTIKAAEKGKHVLCEKTLALDSREAELMAAACRKHGVTLMEGFANRFHPQNLLAKKLVSEGRIGRVVAINTMFSTPKPAADNINLNPQLGGGVLREKGCYLVNYPRFIYGSEPIRVSASVTFGEVTMVDERVTAVLQFSGGGISFMDTGYDLSGNSCYQSAEIFGETGRIYIPQAIFQMETAITGEVVDESVYVAEDRFLVGETKKEKIRVPGVNQWKVEAEYFADRVLQGSDIGFPAEDGLANVRAMDAIYQSSRVGRQIDL